MNEAAFLLRFFQIKTALTDRFSQTVAKELCK